MKSITGNSRVCASIPWVLPLGGKDRIVGWQVLEDCDEKDDL